MKMIFAFLFLILPGLTFAQTGKLYRGSINQKIKITLYLEGLNEGTNADPIIGSYKYDKGKGYILLNGHRNNGGDVSLVELPSVNFTGTFLGTLKKNKITGRWISANQKENYLFELTEVAANQAQLSDFKNAILNKASEFRSY
ncbi:hypothetical protein [uncultured Pedobacter sp.]|uniref:hypothetical protein n=1 Tax=uncultured Pedobacter sp. TaxID=246139 RepID=UPI0025E21E88|nr:hypothetical protein [uncultured Pedobacter sp.]